MKVLFIASNRKGKGLSPFINSQKESLKKHLDRLDLFLISGSGIISYIKSIYQLRSKCKYIQYDIIHAHYGFCGIIALLSFLNKPIIVSFMGDDLLGTPDLKGRYILKSLVYAKINKFFSPFYKSIIVKSKELGTRLPNIPFHIIPNGVDFSKFYPYDKQKARAILGLKENATIIIFGSSANIVRKNYKLAKEALDIMNNKNILLLTLENILSEEVFLYFNAADVLLLVSYHEGSPNVVKEAMACNCPIVSTDVGDVKEVFNNIEGCFICNFTPEDVAFKITQAIQFGKRTNGRNAIAHLEIGLISDRIIALYKSILKN
jgi:teichuronic acid biosynthesis glycosyltransferase TuaC